MGDADRRGHHTRRNQPADVRDVGQQVGADFIGDLAEFLPVRHPRVGRVTGDDHLGLMLLRQRADLVVVKLLGFFVDRVMHRVEPFAAAVDARAVREMPAEEQVHPQHGLAQVHQRLVDGVVGGSARKRLHVDVDIVGADAVGGKGLGGAAAGQRFDGVGVFHALVVARV